MDERPGVTAAASERDSPTGSFRHGALPDRTPSLVAPSLATTAALAVLAVAVPLLITAHYGALGIPRGDDWSYLVTLFRFLDSGELSFNHWVSMSLVGQLLLAAPVAAVTDNDISALQVLTTVVGFLGLGVVAITATRVTGARWAGALLAVTIAAGPLWGPLAVSFMTDVPAFAASAVAMLLAVLAFRRRPVSMPLLVASVLAGFAAFTIRQYAIVSVVAALVTGVGWFMTNADRARVARLIAIGLALTVAAVAFIVWWQAIPDGRPLSPGLPDGHSVRVTVVKGAGFLRLTGLLLLPVLVSVGPIALLQRSWRAGRTLTLTLGSLTTLLLAGTAWRVPGDVFVGNYVMADGVLSDIVLLGPRPDVFPRAAWDAMLVVASAAAVVLVVALVPAIVALRERSRAHDWRMRDPVGTYLAVTIVGYAAAYTVAMATGLQVYDRYILPALPAIGILLLLQRQRQRQDTDATRDRRPARGWTQAHTGGALATLAVLVVVGLAFTADSASFDGARWRAATAATKLGWDPQQVNGGFEWLNYHRRDKLDPADHTRDRGVPLCVTVHINPATVRTAVIAVVESFAPTRPTARLVAFRTARPCDQPRASSP